MHRHLGIDAGGAGVVRVRRADPGDAVVAREGDRGLGGAAHHQVAHAVVAIDQRGRGRGLVDLDIRPRVDGARLVAADVVRQAEDAVRVSPGEIGLGHQLGDPCRVNGREAGRREHVGDEGARDGRGDRRRHHAAPTSLSGMSVKIFCLSAAEMFSALHLPGAFERAHVVGVVAAEHDARWADDRHQRLKLRLRVQDRIVVQRRHRLLGAVVLEVDLRLRPHLLQPCEKAPRSATAPMPPPCHEEPLDVGVALRPRRRTRPRRPRWSSVERITDQVVEVVLRRGDPSRRLAWDAPSSARGARSRPPIPARTRARRGSAG